METIEKEKSIDVVRKMVADGLISQEVAEKYFPELAESEDEKIRKAVIGAVETLSDSPLKVKMLAWIEKQGEQKPAWLEKDEKMFDYALNMIEWYSVVDKSKSRRVSDWLKSLKDRCTWKQSDLQLECLSDAIKHYNSQGYDAPILKELLNELSKLKE